MSGESNNVTNQPHSGNLTKSTPTVASSEKAGIERKLYDIVAEVSLSGPDLLLSPTIKAVSDVTIETEHLTGTTPKHLFISVRGEDFETFERELQQDYTVAEPVLVETYEGRRVYRLEPVSTVELIAPRCPELDARILDVESGDGGWVVRMQIPTRQALVSFREYCLENDVTFRVNQLGNATDHKETDVVGLTEKQKQLLRMAFECGYYEIPRRISQNELAHELDISTSAISQRLRRDTEQLIGSALAVTKKDH